ncbi:hypothetical protein EVAR_24467_1 [Eumeta japonica]|uniref:Uncharacterized protein n=1 Tax=Eumeta variegata TaxID=151549 RepID=A0A4C1WVB6_EUMVA|nr:hypothetical protein EVAR_24467_1 [Eumeta japonica]
MRNYLLRHCDTRLANRADEVKKKPSSARSAYVDDGSEFKKGYLFDSERCIFYIDFSHNYVCRYTKMRRLDRPTEYHALIEYGRGESSGGQFPTPPLSNNLIPLH